MGEANRKSDVDRELEAALGQYDPANMMTAHPGVVANAYLKHRLQMLATYVDAKTRAVIMRDLDPNETKQADALAEKMEKGIKAIHTIIDSTSSETREWFYRLLERSREQQSREFETIRRAKEVGE